MIKIITDWMRENDNFETLEARAEALTTYLHEQGLLPCLATCGCCDIVGLEMSKDEDGVLIVEPVVRSPCEHLH